VNQADNLRAALEQTEGHLHQKGEEKVEGVPESNGKAPSHRQGKKVIMGHFPKKTHLQLKLLAVEQETDIQKLLGEALDLLFEKYDKPLIAK
jgi:hypothetical protein